MDKKLPKYTAGIFRVIERKFIYFLHFVAIYLSPRVNKGEALFSRDATSCSIETVNRGERSYVEMPNKMLDLDQICPCDIFHC